MAFAGSTRAKVDQVLLWEAGNLMYVYPEGGVLTTDGSCHDATLNGDYLTMDMDRPMAQEYLNLIMMAFAAQKTVRFVTSDDCPEQSFVHSIRYLWVDNE